MLLQRGELALARERCGGLSPLDLGDRRLCEECVRLCGSCCLEFGADDLWPREGEPQG
jgi:hypothetical protein